MGRTWLRGIGGPSERRRQANTKIKSKHPRPRAWIGLQEKQQPRPVGRRCAAGRGFAGTAFEILQLLLTSLPGLGRSSQEALDSASPFPALRPEYDLHVAGLRQAVASSVCSSPSFRMPASSPAVFRLQLSPRPVRHVATPYKPAESSQHWSAHLLVEHFLWPVRTSRGYRSLPHLFASYTSASYRIIPQYAVHHDVN